MLFDEGVDRGLRDVELLRDGRDVAVVADEALEEDLLFEDLADLLEGGLGLPALVDGQAHVLLPDLGAVGDDGRPIDHIVELPGVPRPAISLKGQGGLPPDGLGGKAVVETDFPEGGSGAPEAGEEKDERRTEERGGRGRGKI